MRHNTETTLIIFTLIYCNYSKMFHISLMTFSCSRPLLYIVKRSFSELAYLFWVKKEMWFYLWINESIISNDYLWVGYVLLKKKKKNSKGCCACLGNATNNVQVQLNQQNVDIDTPETRYRIRSNMVMEPAYQHAYKNKSISLFSNLLWRLVLKII